MIVSSKEKKFIENKEKKVTSCEGDSIKSKHPRVFISLQKNKPVACIYCGKKYYDSILSD